MKKSARHKTRELALQAIYQWQFTGDPTSAIEVQFSKKILRIKIDKEYFTRLFKGTIAEVKTLDEYMRPILDRSIKELNPVELAILRIAIYELAYCTEIPYKVIINEALELAKTFGATEGFKYVNGILDKIAQKIRATEFQENR